MSEDQVSRLPPEGGDSVAGTPYIQTGQQEQSPVQYTPPREIFCPHCQGGNPPGAITCQWCNRSMRIPGPTVAVPTPYTSSAQPQQAGQTKRRKPLYIMAGLVAGLLVLCSLVGVAAMLTSTLTLAPSVVSVNVTATARVLQTSAARSASTAVAQTRVVTSARFASADATMTAIQVAHSEETTTARAVIAMAPTNTRRPAATATLDRNGPYYIKQLTAYKEGDKAYAVYFVLADASGAMVPGEGKADLSFVEVKTDYRTNTKTENVLYTNSYKVERSHFQRATVGLGAFEHEVLLASFGRITYSDFMAQPVEYSGKVKLTFTLTSGQVLSAEESVFYDVDASVVSTATAAGAVQATMVAPATATAEASVFEVLGPTTYVGRYIKALHVVGIIRYNGDTPRGKADIVATLTGPNGEVLGTDDALYTPAIIKPHSVIPYLIYFSEPPASWDKIEITVRADPLSDFEQRLYTDQVEVTQSSLSGGNKVLGRVKNTSSKNVGSATIVGVLYDPSGKVLDVAQTYSKLDKLAPGEESTFDLDFNSEAGGGKTYQLFVSGYIQD